MTNVELVKLVWERSNDVLYGQLDVPEFLRTEMQRSDTVIKDTLFKDNDMPEGAAEELLALAGKAMRKFVADLIAESLHKPSIDDRLRSMQENYKQEN